MTEPEFNPDYDPDSIETPWEEVLLAIDTQDRLIEEGAKQLVDGLELIEDPGLSLIASLLHVQIMATMNTNSSLRWLLAAVVTEVGEEDGEA